MEQPPLASPPPTNLLNRRHSLSQQDIPYLEHPLLGHLSHFLTSFLSFLAMSLAHLLSWIYPTRISIIDSELPPLIMEEYKPVDLSTSLDDDSFNEIGSFWETDLTSTPSSVDTSYSVLRKPSISDMSVRIPASPGLNVRVNSAPPCPPGTSITSPRIRATNSENGVSVLEQRGVNRVAIISGNQSPIPGQIRDIFNGVEVSVSLSADEQPVQAVGLFQWKLVALNLGRSAILKSGEGIRGIALVADLLREQTIQDVFQVRTLWVAGGHPDIDKVHHISYFDRFMNLQSASEFVPNEENLVDILMKLQPECGNVVALLVVHCNTGILTCLRIPTPRGDVFATLHLQSSDSGRSLVFFNNTINATAARLGQFLQAPAPNGMANTTTALAHIFIARESKGQSADVHHALFEQSILTFDLHKSLEQTKVHHEALRMEKQETDTKLDELKKAYEAQTIRIDALTADNLRLTAEVDSCNQTRQQTVATLSARIDFLENENRRLRSLSESAPKDSQSTPPPANPAPAEGQRPAGKMKQSSSKTDNLVADNQRLQAEVKALQNQLNTLTLDNSRLIAKSKMRGSRITALVAENQRAQSELKSTTERLNRMATERRLLEGGLRHQPSQQPTISEPTVMPAGLGDPQLHASVVSLASLDDSVTIVDPSHFPSREEEVTPSVNPIPAGGSETRPMTQASEFSIAVRSGGSRVRHGLGIVPNALTDGPRRMAFRLRGHNKS